MLFPRLLSSLAGKDWEAERGKAIDLSRAPDVVPSHRSWI